MVSESENILKQHFKHKSNDQNFPFFESGVKKLSINFSFQK